VNLPANAQLASRAATRLATLGYDVDTVVDEQRGGFVDRSHLAFRGAAPTALGALHNAGDVLIDRVRRY
jgi:hypothetical protein